MQLRALLLRPPAIVAACVCGAALLSEVLRVQAEDTALQLRQERWNCWAIEASKGPTCVAQAKRGPLDDADFCGRAVAACKTKGWDGKIARGDARMLSWDSVAYKLRLVVFTTAVGALLGYGAGRPIWRISRARQCKGA